MSNNTRILAISDAKQRAPLLTSLDQAFTLHYAADSEEVIDKTSDETPIDLLLVDIDSLEGDALDMCLWLKTDQETKELPVVVIGNDEANISKWLKIGALDYLLSTTSHDLAAARIKNQLELKYKTDLLENIANLDGLTALPNTNRMNEYVDIEWRRSLREFYPISLIKIDLDHFAEFNDHYGLGAGNDAMKSIARTLQENCSRAGDMVSRYNSDEFIVLLPNTELESAIVVAERMLQSVVDLAIIHEGSKDNEVITASAGVATIEPSIDKRYQDLFDEADEMLHSAQQLGGGRLQGVEV